MIEFSIVPARPYIRLLAFGPTPSELSPIIYDMPGPLVVIDPYGHAPYSVKNQDDLSVLQTREIGKIVQVARMVQAGRLPCGTFAIDGLSAIQDELAVLNGSQGFQGTFSTRKALVDLLQILNGLDAHVVITARSKDEYAAVGSMVYGQLIGTSDKIVVGLTPDLDRDLKNHVTMQACVRDGSAEIIDSYYHESLPPKTVLRPANASGFLAALDPVIVKAASPAAPVLSVVAQQQDTAASTATKPAPAPAGGDTPPAPTTSVAETAAKEQGAAAVAETATVVATGASASTGTLVEDYRQTLVPDGGASAQPAAPRPADVQPAAEHLDEAVVDETPASNAGKTGDQTGQTLPQGDVPAVAVEVRAEGAQVSAARGDDSGTADAFQEEQRRLLDPYLQAVGALGVKRLLKKFGNVGRVSELFEKPALFEKFRNALVAESNAIHQRETAAAPPQNPAPPARGNGQGRKLGTPAHLVS